MRQVDGLNQEQKRWLCISLNVARRHLIEQERQQLVEARRQRVKKASSIKGRLERGRMMLRNRLIRRGVTLSRALLAAAVDAPAATSVAQALVQATVKAAKTGAVRCSVAVLMKAAVPVLWAGKARLAVGVLLAVSLLAVGGSTLAPPSTAPETPTAPQAERRQPQPAPVKNKVKDAVLYTGRVLGLKDKPIAGAKVYFFFTTLQQEAIPVRATTDEQGHFEFALTPKDIPLSADTEHGDPRKTGHLVVKADGFTFAWGYAALHQKDGTFHVAADNTPLTGRIIDLQGKPLAGLHVKAWSVAAPQKGDLAPFVQALQARESFYNALFRHVPNRLQSPFYWDARTPLLPSTTTDSNGSFRLHSFAKEQVIELRLEGPAAARAIAFAFGRPPTCPTLLSSKMCRL